ncbi:MAG TPA: phosphoglucosamine mutase [Baekduia sp.]|nr:phosphoglucosamine mutase [Baekduia sp.]
MARKLFGTDGVRGVAGETLTADLASDLGRAAAAESQAKRPRVLVVRDTRESGEGLQAALAEGVMQAGGEVLLGGVLPTPAVPLLINRYGYDLGVVISASHNPYQDNGIKFFGPDGFKLSDETELAIEARIEAPFPHAEHPGTTQALDGTLADYIDELHKRFQSLDLSGVDIVIDCANGSTFEAAPEIFRRLGAAPTVIAASPDGRNINDHCGSTHIDALAKVVVDGGHDIGFAFDGDGDRVLAVDGNGVVVDGDELIALASLHLQSEGRLGGGVVVTVMTNYGFFDSMRTAGIETVTASVGDRYVLEELRARGWALGGEQSGHIIDMGFCPSGDGIAAALLTLEALGGRPLAARDAMTKLPQRLVNVKVADRDAAMASPALAQATADEAAKLEGRGRVLVRPSGTEQLVRVMVEAPTEDEADAVCGRLVAVAESGA